MAKRRRLSPARGLELGPEGMPEVERFARETSPDQAPAAGIETKSSPSLPPIAAMAGDISRRAAIEEMAASLEIARHEGRLAEALPLDAIVEDHLIRDRAAIDETEMEALTESLRARGQQVPIEVTELGGGRYGLISGWRRLTALRRLAAEGQGPAIVAAFLRRPDGDAAAYLAMVEENEIRADLGFWERGRIVARAVEAGVFEDTRAALLGLFGSVPRARRSKIGSFVTLVRLLDGTLRFPEALSEKAGLALEQRLRDGGEGSEAAVASLRHGPEGCGSGKPGGRGGLSERLADPVRWRQAGRDRGAGDRAAEIRCPRRAKGGPRPENVHAGRADHPVGTGGGRPSLCRSGSLVGRQGCLLTAFGPVFRARNTGPNRSGMGRLRTERRRTCRPPQGS